jgi:hypothetical protein
MTPEQHNALTAANDPAVRSSVLLSVSYGFGTNSTAMLCGMLERGIKPDVILAADTGAEMPHSYRMLETYRCYWDFLKEKAEDIKYDASMEHGEDAAS